MRKSSYKQRQYILKRYPEFTELTYYHICNKVIDVIKEQESKVKDNIIRLRELTFKLNLITICDINNKAVLDEIQVLVINRTLYNWRDIKAIAISRLLNEF